MDRVDEAVRELTGTYDDYFVLSDALRADAQRILDEPRQDQTWRRNLVRATWPMIEALAETLRRICKVLVHHCELDLSQTHRHLVNDESNFRTSQRLKESLKLAYKLHELEPSVSFGERSWQDVQDAIAVRDRIMHPKSSSDLVIDDEEWVRVYAGLSWALDALFSFFELVHQKYGPSA